IDECERRREIQTEFNTKHKITPRSIEKAIHQGIEEFAEAQNLVMELAGQEPEEYALANFISDLERQMELAARNLQFEKAAMIRDKIKEFKETGVVSSMKKM
ncbi:MAG TPA: UvrB/UvrC motif-containing protein, partial [Candidatus Omnitrophota bacterium]|nr:UvrB/UvrC motif-containing protein [Candidatus Omnitrophota bacterium]